MEIRGKMLGSPMEVKIRHFGFLILAKASHVIVLRRCSVREKIKLIREILYGISIISPDNLLFLGWL